MRKTTALILTIICLIMPLIVMGETKSPTIESLWHAEPKLAFQLIQSEDEFYEYLELISTYYDLSGFNDMVLGTDEYELVDMIIVTLDKPYERVIWRTPYSFTPESNLSVFMISTDLLQGYVLTAQGDKDTNLVVNYSGIMPNMYFMIIFMAY